MRLVPDNYVCPLHGDELSSLVATELSTDPAVVASRWLVPGRRPRGPVPFLVIVQCPGGGGHELDLEGSWSP